MFSQALAGDCLGNQLLYEIFGQKTEVIIILVTQQLARPQVWLRIAFIPLSKKNYGF